MDTATGYQLSDKERKTSTGVASIANTIDLVSDSEDPNDDDTIDLVSDDESYKVIDLVSDSEDEVDSNTAEICKEKATIAETVGGKAILRFFGQKKFTKTDLDFVRLAGVISMFDDTKLMIKNQGNQADMELRILKG